MKRTKKVYVAWVNTDLTEGRGRQIPLCICESKTTAARLGAGKDVQGSNASVSEEDAFYIGNHWYGPVAIERPSSDDVATDAKIKARLELIARVKIAGLSDADIVELSSLKIEDLEY